MLKTQRKKKRTRQLCGKKEKNKKKVLIESPSGNQVSMYAAKNRNKSLRTVLSSRGDASSNLSHTNNNDNSNNSNRRDGQHSRLRRSSNRSKITPDGTVSSTASISQGGAASDKSKAPSVSIARRRKLMKKRIGKDGTIASSSSFHIGAGKVVMVLSNQMTIV